MGSDPQWIFFRVVFHIEEDEISILIYFSRSVLEIGFILSDREPFIIHVAKTKTVTKLGTVLFSNDLFKWWKIGIKLLDLGSR